MVLIYKMWLKIFLSGYYFEIFKSRSEIFLPFASQGFSIEKKSLGYKVAYLPQNLLKRGGWRIETHLDNNNHPLYDFIPG